MLSLLLFLVFQWQFVWLVTWYLMEFSITFSLYFYVFFFFFLVFVVGFLCSLSTQIFGCGILVVGSSVVLLSVPGSLLSLEVSDLFRVRVSQVANSFSAGYQKEDKKKKNKQTMHSVWFWCQVDGTHPGPALLHNRRHSN